MQPGTIFSCLPPQPDDQQRRVHELEQTVREQGSANTGQAMQVGAGGILVNDGGSITIQAPGTLNVAGGVLNSAGDITAAGNVRAGNGAAEMTSSGVITGASLNVGPVTAGSVVSSGQVQSNGAPLLSLPSHSYTVSSNYIACWINGDGTFGVTSSSGMVKTSLTPMTAADAQALLNLTPYWGRYVWDDPAVPPRVFFLAEDVKAAGFGPDVAPTVQGEPMTLTSPDGKPILDSTGAPCVIPVGGAYTVNYSQMVVPLVAAWHAGAQQLQALQTQVQALAAQVAALTPTAAA